MEGDFHSRPWFGIHPFQKPRPGGKISGHGLVLGVESKTARAGQGG